MMKMYPLVRNLLLAGLVAFGVGACNDDDSETNGQQDDVLNLTIRSVPDEAVWADALSALMKQVAAEPGYITGQEFRSVFSALPTDPLTGQGIQHVYFGLDQYDSQSAYDTLLTKYSENPPQVLTDYQQTNENLLTIQVQPYRHTGALDVANMVQSGQVLEIAVRDVSNINFDDFDSLRQSFVDLLLKQPGVLQEFEYRSADGQYYVGMTLYESLAAFQSVVSNPAIAQGSEFLTLLNTYPPLFSQFAMPIDYSADADDVFELAIRTVNDPTQLETFTSSRDNFVAVLREQNGVLVDREFAATDNTATQQRYVGMTSYENLATFQQVSNTLGSSAEAADFFQTFTPTTFTALKPLVAGTVVNLADLVPAGSGHMLEIAVRDLSQYPNFDQADYENKRDAFLALLAQQPGRLAEYQWVSAIDSNLVVGMTVYESPEAYEALLTKQDFISDPRVAAFIGTYPGHDSVQVFAVR